MGSLLAVKIGLNITATRYGGRTSTQIAARVGAIPAKASVTADKIPVSESVVITATTTSIAMRTQLRLPS